MPHRPHRRDFLAHSAFTAISLALAGCASDGRQSAAARPNILWITAEDMNAHLGCYGDPIARTPNLDRFATQSTRYTHAFATAPVCSPARSCLISGMYATTLGTHPLRCQVPYPSHIRGFPAYLREAGYFTSNNVKTDYNAANEKEFVADAWDRCAADAHWRQRRDNQPFFSVFNLMTTHQSRSSTWPWEQFEREVASQLSGEQRTDPARVVIPPYYPDTQLARRTLARYYDCIAVMDKQVGELLQQLEDDGLAGNTIVFFYGDNGAGIPRHKRLLHDSGLRVPLLIRFPRPLQHLATTRPGQTSDRLVSFVDFAPTILSLCDLPIPGHLQGEPFLGRGQSGPRQFVYGARDRVDEAIDLSRSVRDRRYLYIRNYMPHVSWAPPEGYSDQSEFRREILQLATEGKLNEAQLTYAGPRKPVEELYDCEADPHQVHNLAGDPQHARRLDRMRELHRNWVLGTRDMGFLTESEILARSGGLPPFEVGQDRARYDLDRIHAAAAKTGCDSCSPLPDLNSPDPAVRYWGAVNLRYWGSRAGASTGQLEAKLRDPSPDVRIEIAAHIVSTEDRPHQLSLETLAEILTGMDKPASVHAARAIQSLGEKASPLAPVMKAMIEKARTNPSDDPLMFIRFALEPLVAEFSKGG